MSVVKTDNDHVIRTEKSFSDKKQSCKNNYHMKFSKLPLQM